MTFLRSILTNPWAQGLAAGAAILLLVFALDRCARYAMTAMTRSATEAGRQEQQATDLRETITRTERANHAAETIRRDPDARHADCVQRSRNPHDC